MRWITDGNSVFDGNIVIAVVDGKNPEARKYNARLIAKAPELLEVLKQMVSAHGCGCGGKDCLQCAVEKVAENLINEIEGVYK